MMWSEKIPFQCEMQGNVFVNNATIRGHIDVSTLKIDGQNALTANNKLSTQYIEDLVVGGNVKMSSNATISWGQISNQPNIPRTAAELGALSTSSQMLTHITSTGVYTGTITANQLTAGKIKAQYIDTENLSANRITKSGSNGTGYLTLSAPNSSGQSLSDLELWYGISEQTKSRWFRVYNTVGGAELQANDIGFLGSTGDSTFASGVWDFSGARVTGITAKFA